MQDCGGTIAPIMAVTFSSKYLLKFKRTYPIQIDDLASSNFEVETILMEKLEEFVRELKNPENF